jgi:hypothetical protein
MRLGKTARGAIEARVKQALSGQCEVIVPAPAHVAGRMFEAVDPHIQEFGGQPDPRRRRWTLPNGSVIRLASA